MGAWGALGDYDHDHRRVRQGSLSSGKLKRTCLGSGCTGTGEVRDLMRKLFMLEKERPRERAAGRGRT